MSQLIANTDGLYRVASTEVSDTAEMEGLPSYADVLACPYTDVVARRESGSPGTPPPVVDPQLEALLSPGARAARTRQTASSRPPRLDTAGESSAQALGSPVRQAQREASLERSAGDAPAPLSDRLWEALESGRGLAKLLSNTALGPPELCDVVNAPGDAGKTLLMAAAQTGDAEACDTLLIRNADLFAKDANGHTAVFYAAAAGHAATVQRLLSRGAHATDAAQAFKLNVDKAVASIVGKLVSMHDLQPIASHWAGRAGGHVQLEALRESAGLKFEYATLRQAVASLQPENVEYLLGKQTFKHVVSLGNDSLVVDAIRVRGTNKPHGDKILRLLLGPGGCTINDDCVTRALEAKDASLALTLLGGGNFEPYYVALTEAAIKADLQCVIRRFLPTKNDPVTGDEKPSRRHLGQRLEVQALEKGLDATANLLAAYRAWGHAASEACRLYDAACPTASVVAEKKGFKKLFHGLKQKVRPKASEQAEKAAPNPAHQAYADARENAEFCRERFKSLLSNHTALFPDPA